MDNENQPYFPIDATPPVMRAAIPAMDANLKSPPAVNDWFSDEGARQRRIARETVNQPDAKLTIPTATQPSVLAQKLAALGCRTTDLEPTEHAFHGIVRAGQRRVVVLTPFFDGEGAMKLQTL